MADGGDVQHAPAPSVLAQQLDELGASARGHLAAAHEGREAALRACREVIRTCGSAIRAVHRHDPAGASRLRDEAGKALRAAQAAMAPFPRLAAAGFLHDAEKEYAEAHLTASLVAGGAVPGPDDLDVSVAAWLNGMAEAASELRRHLLDQLRVGRTDEAVALVEAMGDCYDVLVTIDFPDAVTGGLRRATDALRAVLERSRSDVTTTVLQQRLQASIDGLARRLGDAG
ncbi:MAG: haloacid dehalogenase [Actinomycetota bacterium]|nr:haloacid dehalogenase [Actinomycetota bacterium]